MLERLHVADLGIIEEVELEFGPGLTALTGETGAGKSLLVGSLKLLAGGRATADLVRTGSAALRVEGAFRIPGHHPVVGTLEALGLPLAGDELILRREVAATGRSRAWVNDAPVTAGALQAVANHILSIHGQHEQHGLADPVVQRRLVDEYAGHATLMEGVAQAFAHWERVESERRRMEAARSRRRDRLDAIAFQLGEIDAVAPEPGEDERLQARRSVLRNAARIGELGTMAIERLGGEDRSVVSELARALREAREMTELGFPVQGTVEVLEGAGIQAAEALRELEEAMAHLEHDPHELDAVESRLHALETLMLKYGSPVEAVLEHRARLLDEKARLEAIDENLAAARKAAAEALEAYDRAARALQQSRKAAGKKLLDEVGSILGQLAMDGTGLEFRWSARAQDGSPLERDGVPVAFDAGGVEGCELFIAPNRGEALRPMSRIASGGELSRLHLAIRTALRRRRGEAPMTLLFDEVDTGLGGATAAALGTLLAGLAETDQVLVVTHLPQVAARARAHYRVAKRERAHRTVAGVTLLLPEERVQELARMLSGDRVGPTALEHARRLLEDR